MHVGLSALTLLALSLPAAEAQSLKEITYLSSADQSKQKAMFYAPDGKEAVPLVVALHTWGGDYTQDFHKGISDWCLKNGWAYIHPNFRGRSDNPKATGSDLVVQDILDAVTFAKGAAKIDGSAVFLVGTSGGGHVALLMAGRHPEVWAGVSAWAGLGDLKAHYFYCLERAKGYERYSAEIAKSCGGPPGTSPEVDDQYRKRSPNTYLAKAKGLKLHINAGDGDTGVPTSQSFHAFNEVADAKDRLTEDEIKYFVDKHRPPPQLKQDIVDPSYGKKRPVFRRTSGNVTITIFSGNHEIVPEAAMAWFQKLREEKKTH
jgi:dipeptidyl aminopeptidase/acylaminoacyl peptidase